MSSDESEISFNDSDSGSDLFGDSAFDREWEDLEEEERGALLSAAPLERRAGMTSQFPKRCHAVL